MTDREYYYEGGDDCDCDDEEWEIAMQDCGQYGEAGGCALLGTEYCDFECPFRGDLFADEKA